MNAPERDELAAAVDAMGGALPMPVGTVHAVMAPEQRKAIVVQIGEAKPATDALIGLFAESVANVRNHEHPSWEDLYCMNLTSYMGERMAPVLRRLLNAENEVVRLRARVAELEAQAEKVAADRDAQIIAWLVKKSGEYRGDTRESAADALARMADKLHRGAVRPPVPAAPRPRLFLSGSPLEDQHDSPPHHDYATPRDLPEVTR